MNRNELEQQIIGALENNPYCSFSTVENGKPKARYMA
ncbi:general stress protein, partial [Escherichia coli]|nr:general stress protein [Escherichia coli]